MAEPKVSTPAPSAASSSPPPPPPPHQDASRPKRPWRDNLEAFGIAILFAVLLKPMIIEAYQIPTPSMQPTLMGSPEAGVHDRILVNKVRFELFEPKRWDIVVFRYPIRRNQNYVKRIVGMPGDLIRIAGGNLYRVDEDGKILEVIRKPDRIQDGLWKELYPARRLLDNSPKVLAYFHAGGAGKWEQQGEGLVYKPASGGRAWLSFSSGLHGGFGNQIYDGYPTDIATEIRNANGADHDAAVQDVRIQFVLTPQETVTSLQVELKLRPPGHDLREYRLEVADGVGHLVILTKQEEKARSEPFDCALTGGESVTVGFTHVDDRLIASVDGDDAMSLEVGDQRVTELLDINHLDLQIESRDGGKLSFSELTVWRDLHYLPNGLEDDASMQPLKDHIIRIPEGHYMMMGDNTRASADSRQWKTITVGMKDGWLVEPKEDDPSIRIVTGNKRAWNLEAKPDNDENPVVIRAAKKGVHDTVVFTDAEGEVYALKARLAPGYRPDEMKFLAPDGNLNSEWTPPEQHVYFVPREHILGRTLTGFWPVVWPSRVGFIQ